MASETIPYTEGSDSFDAFIARPDESGAYPAILVCHALGRTTRPSAPSTTQMRTAARGSR